MTAIRKILRLRHASGLTRAEVSAAVGVSERTGIVTYAANGAPAAAGLSWSRKVWRMGGRI